MATVSATAASTGRSAVRPPDLAAYPTISVPNNVGNGTGTRKVAFNVLLGGWPYLLQYVAVPSVNKATNLQYGCVPGVDANGNVLLTNPPSQTQIAPSVQPPSMRPNPSGYPV